MEPNLEDMSDYDKPLSTSKTKAIVLSFAALIAIYVLYAFVMSGS